ncbi:MAG: hypothetical protein ACI9BW_000852, partial [Gammaproteobacteria bacterium]
NALVVIMVESIAYLERLRAQKRGQLNKSLFYNSLYNIVNELN